MEYDVLRVVLTHAANSDKVLVKQSSTGKSKVKIKHGFLGMKTKRIYTDAETLEMIKANLRKICSIRKNS